MQTKLELAQNNISILTRSLAEARRPIAAEVESLSDADCSSLALNNIALKELSARLAHYVECSRFDNSQLVNHEKTKALEELNSNLETAQAQFELQKKEITLNFAKKLETNF